jgi:hypothetical protein
VNHDDIHIHVPLSQPRRAPIDPRLLDGLKAVKPAPAVGALALRLLVLTIALLALGALAFGTRGVRAMSGAQIALYSAIVAAGAAGFAYLAANESSPAARRRLAPVAATGTFFALLAVGFIPLFVWHPASGFPMTTCIVLTLSGSALAIAASWALLRRGFFVRPMAAGLASASLAAATGFSIIQTLCPYMEGVHILSAHVLPAAGFAFVGGAAMASFLRRKNRT